MARSKKKTTEQRLQAEARRRQTDAGRKAEQRNDQWLADVRRQLREGAEQAAFERRLAAAIAVTDEFAWKPWGYEITPVKVAGLTVRHLKVVPAPPRRLRNVSAEPEPKARQRFATVIAHPSVRLRGAGLVAA